MTGWQSEWVRSSFPWHLLLLEMFFKNENWCQHLTAVILTCQSNKSTDGINNINVGLAFHSDEPVPELSYWACSLSDTAYWNRLLKFLFTPMIFLLRHTSKSLLCPRKKCFLTTYFIYCLPKYPRHHYSTFFYGTVYAHGLQSRSSSETQNTCN